MLHNDEMPPLLLKWFNSLVRCTQQSGRAMVSTYAPLIVHTLCHFNDFDSQTAHKMSDLGYRLCTKNGMLCNEERPSSLMRWFIAFLIYIRKVRGASDSIYKPLMVHILCHCY